MLGSYGHTRREVCRAWRRTAAPLGAPTTPDVEPWLAGRVILMIRAADLSLETGHHSSSDGKKLAVRTLLGVP